MRSVVKTFKRENGRGYRVRLKMFATKSIYYAETTYYLLMALFCLHNHLMTFKSL